MPVSISRPAARILIAISVLIGLATASHAAVIRWINPTGGNAFNSSNWSPAQLPGAADEARFDTTGTYSVTWNATTDSTDAMRFRGGDVNLLFTSLHDVKSQFAVAQNSNETATARVVDGTLRAGWSLLVGAGSGSNGTLVVDGATTDLLQNIGPGTPLMSVGGANSTGLVRITQGGKVVLADRLRLGTSAGGNATLRVRGQGTGFFPRRSQFLADGATAEARIGANDSHGLFEVLEGGLARFARTVFAGEEPGDSAEVVIGGRGTIDSSRFVIVGDLFIAANHRSVGGGGWSRITLDSLGVMEVGDTTEIGDLDGSNGRLTLARGSRFVTRHLALRQPLNQVIDLQGGLLQIKGGSLSDISGRLVVPGAVGDPTIELLNGARADFIGTNSSPPILIGTTDDAALRVTGGSAMAATGGAPTLAAGAAATVDLVVSDGATFTSDQRLVAGIDGRAQVSVLNLAQLNVQGADVGTSGTQTSYITVLDFGQFISGGLLHVGGTASGGSGYGQVSVADGGTITLSRPGQCGTVWQGGHLFVADGGQMDLGSSLVVHGELGVFDGTITGGPLQLRGNGILHGYGDVPASIGAGADTTVAIVADGTLALGSSGSANGFLMRGTLDVGAHSVTLRDADSAVVGVARLGGGDLYLPPGGGVMEAGKRLSGQGTVHGDLTNRGLVIGTSGELRFAGNLLGSGEGVSADSMRFLAGGGFVGAGNLDGRVRCDSGSVIRATGPLGIGRINPLPLNDAVVLRGRIDTGPHAVNLVNALDPIVYGEITLGGGSLSAVPSTQLVGAPGSRITGRGRIGRSWSGSSEFSPGPGAGRLQFLGTLVIGPGRYVAELGNHATTEHDTLAVTGVVAIGPAGTVLDLRRLPSFSAVPGDSFRVIEYPGHIGAFSTVTLDGQSIAGNLEVHYNSTGLWVVMLPGIVSVDDSPRPAAGITAIRYTSFGSPGRDLGVDLALPAATRASLDVFDVHGRRVASLHEGMLAAGRHRFELRHEFGAAGVLFARATIGEGAGRTVRTLRLVRLH